MICIYNYYIAKHRLKEAIKTVEMMGGEEECQPMVVAQRDFIAMEIDYYVDQMKSLLTWSVISTIIGIPTVWMFLHFKGYV